MVLRRSDGTPRLVALEKVDLGFDPASVLVAQLNFTGITGGPFKPPSTPTLDMLRRKVEELPGVNAVSFGDQTPLDGVEISSSIEVLGYAPHPGEEPTVNLVTVADGYFRTLGLPLISGQQFEDIPTAQANVAVINKEMAQRYWPGSSAVGRQVVVNGETLKVLGVAGDVREKDPWDAPEPSLYYRYPGLASAYVEMLVRSAGGSISNLSAADDPASDAGAATAH
jgi:putative ABC transport system permease protein